MVMRMLGRVLSGQSHDELAVQFGNTGGRLLRSSDHNGGTLGSDSLAQITRMLRASRRPTAKHWCCCPGVGQKWPGGQPSNGALVSPGQKLPFSGPLMAAASKICPLLISRVGSVANCGTHIAARVTSRCTSLHSFLFSYNR